MTSCPVRIGLDATPLLGPRTGVGQYVAHLVPALRSCDPSLHLSLTAFTWRGARHVPPLGGARVTGRRVPARALRQAWLRWDVPPVEWLAGRVEVFHGTNFVLPPARRAGGVVTVHDLGFLLHPGTLDKTALALRDLVPRSVRRAALVLTPSRAVAQEAQQHLGLPADRVRVTPLGVDDAWSRATPADPRWLSAHSLPTEYLLFVGTQEPRKNLPTLLAAHRLLRARHPDTPPLVLAGPAGWGPPPALAARDDVIQAGYLPKEELRAVVAGARLLVLPSRYEGFGLPPLEAFACGVAAVVSDLPVTREVTGGLATYVPAGEVEAMAAGLAEALQDDAEPRRRARRDWAARWTWERCAAATRDAYRDATH